MDTNAPLDWKAHFSDLRHCIDELNQSDAMIQYNLVNMQIIRGIQKATHSQSLADMVHAETAFLQNELERFGDHRYLRETHGKMLAEMDILQDRISRLEGLASGNVSPALSEPSKQQTDKKLIQDGETLLVAHREYLARIDTTRLMETDRNVIEARLTMWDVALSLYHSKMENISDLDVANAVAHAQGGNSLPAAPSTTPAKVNVDSPAFQALMQGQKPASEEEQSASSSTKVHRPG